MPARSTPKLRRAAILTLLQQSSSCCLPVLGAAKLRTSSGKMSTSSESACGCLTARLARSNLPQRTGSRHSLFFSLPRLANNLYVIPGNRVGAASGAIDRVWSRARSAAGLRDVRLHDLRHSFASIGVVDGLSLPIIGALLGHKHSATTARYAHVAPGPLPTANDAVGSKIAAAMRMSSAAPTDASPECAKLIKKY